MEIKYSETSLKVNKIQELQNFELYDHKNKYNFYLVSYTQNQNLFLLGNDLSEIKLNKHKNEKEIGISKEKLIQHFQPHGSC